MAEFIIGSPLRRVARRYPTLQRLLWWLDFVLVWMLVKVFTLLPIDFASRLGRRVGRWIGPRMRRKTALYRENMRVAFPDLSEEELDARVRDAWGQAGRILAEYPHLEKFLRQEDRLEIVIKEPIPAYTDPEHPCVVVSAHVSNWEIVCSAMAKMGMPNASLYTPPTNPYFDRMLADSRKALNCELLARDNSARLLMKALKSGRTAGMVMDRRVDEGHPIRFFGRDKLTTLVPARLALKFNCELVPAHVERLHDARYRVTFLPPVRPRDPAAGETEQAVDMTEQLHGLFESWIRENPADWFCSKRLWDKPIASSDTKPPEKKSSIESYPA